MHRGTWKATVHGVAKKSDMTEHMHRERKEGKGNVADIKLLF